MTEIIESYSMFSKEKNLWLIYNKLYYIWKIRTIWCWKTERCYPFFLINTESFIEHFQQLN